MIEAKLYIKYTQLSKHPDFTHGKVTRETEIKDVLTWDRDDRKNIAPFGLRGTIFIERGGTGITDVFDFNISNNYFYKDALPDTYHCSFYVDDKSYTLSFSVANDQIADLTLYERSEYEPIRCHYKNEFTEYYKMLP